MITDASGPLRPFLRQPILQIADAARYLDAAVSAHLAGYCHEAEKLIRLADMPAIRDWTESLWGKNSPYVKVQQADPLPNTSNQVGSTRRPSAAQSALLHQRDGYHCRFCGIPVIRAEVRERIRVAYPNALTWGRRNVEQHSGFQAMWVQYDHVIPFTRGGATDVENLVVTCAPCNFGRMEHTVAEVGLLDPRDREPVRSLWDGLERFR